MKQCPLALIANQGSSFGNNIECSSSCAWWSDEFKVCVVVLLESEEGNQ